MSNSIQDLLAEKARQAEDKLVAMLEERLLPSLAELRFDGEIRSQFETLGRTMDGFSERQGSLREEFAGQGRMIRQWLDKTELEMPGKIGTVTQQVLDERLRLTEEKLESSTTEDLGGVEHRVLEKVDRSHTELFNALVYEHQKTCQLVKALSRELSLAHTRLADSHGEQAKLRKKEALDIVSQLAGLKQDLGRLPEPLVKRVDELQKELMTLEMGLRSAVERLDALGRGSDQLRTAQKELIETTNSFSTALASEYPKIEFFSKNIASLQHTTLEVERRLRRRFLVAQLLVAAILVIGFVFIYYK